MMTFSKAYTQTAPHLISKCTQTPFKQKVDKETSYESQQNYDIGDTNMIVSMLEKVGPMVERALQDNETIDIFADYCNIPEKGDISLFYNIREDEGFKPVGSFSDLNFSRGQFVQHIAFHPNQVDVIATSLCNSRDVTIHFNPWIEEDRSIPSVAIWQLENAAPISLLKSPADCTVFHFNTLQPQLIAGGCRNGSVVLWDLSITKLQEVNSNQGVMPPMIQPVLMCCPGHGPNGIVTDLCWLPPQSQINAKGKIIDGCHLTEISHQFLTVSGDGQIMFWDVRFKEILEGKLPFIAKVKKQVFEYDDDFPYIKWMPLYKIKPKQSFGSRNISFCKAFIPLASEPHNLFHATELLCASEESDLISINWSPKSSSQEDASGENMMKDIPPQHYVQWTRKDHSRPCLSLEQSPFFPHLVLSVCDWNFHLWEIGETVGKSPIFTSPSTSSFITCGKWSPTRPAVIFITKADGAIDIWDFITEGCYTPHSTIQLVANKITSIAFKQNTGEMSQLVMIGDSSGALNLFEVPLLFAKPVPNEYRSIENIFHTRPDRTSTTDTSDSTISCSNVENDTKEECSGTLDTHQEEESLGLTEEEEAQYAKMEAEFFST